MSARAHKVDPVGLDLVYQQEIAPNVAFPVIGPFAFQWVIQPFRAKRRDVLPSWHATPPSRQGFQRLAP